MCYLISEQGEIMKSSTVLGLILLFLSWPATAQSPLDTLSADELADGGRLFRVHCARCHGVDGAGGEGSSLARPTLKHAADDQALITLIETGIPGTGMPGSWMFDDDQLTRIAGYVKTLGRLEQGEMPGDPQNGASIYEDSGGCSACHILAGRGKGVGPELTSIGDSRGLDYLRSSLLEPEAAQSETGGFQDYLTVRIQTANNTVEGLRVNEDAFSIQVRDVAGDVHSFRKNELIELEKIFSHSLMPDYANTLSEQDMNDLISFLMSLRSQG
jgi:putative heme-binding domain-containing protein